MLVGYLEHTDEDTGRSFVANVSSSFASEVLYTDVVIQRRLPVLLGGKLSEGKFVRDYALTLTSNPSTLRLEYELFIPNEERVVEDVDAEVWHIHCDEGYQAVQVITVYSQNFVYFFGGEDTEYALWYCLVPYKGS